MCKQKLESELRQLGNDWPVRSVADAVLGRLSAQPPSTAVPKQTRMTFPIVIGTSLAVATALLVAFIINLSTPKTLYAAVQQSLNKAKTAYMLAEIFREGRTEKAELWFDKTRGFRMKSNGYVVVDDGRKNFAWSTISPNEAIVLQRPSVGGEDMIATMLGMKAGPVKIQEMRSPEHDRSINGVACKAYAGMHDLTYEVGNKPSEHRTIVFIDDQWRPLLFTTERRNGDNWVLVHRKSMNYDVEIGKQTFAFDYPAKSRVVDAKSGMDQRFPLKNALAQTEVGGLIFAVHRATPLDDGSYFVLSSVRGTSQYLNKYPPVRRKFNLNHDRWNVISHSLTSTSARFHCVEMSHANFYGVEYKWWTISPRRYFRLQDDEREYLPVDAQPSLGSTPNTISVQLFAGAYHPQAPQGQSPTLNVEYSRNVIPWVKAVGELRRDLEYLAMLWGDGSTTGATVLVQPGEAIERIMLETVSNEEYAADMRSRIKRSHDERDVIDDEQADFVFE